MLLTISTTQQPATDLGFLLHKHPDRVQEFDMSWGTATVFYPEASDERCTAALMLTVDPIRLARSRRSTPDFALAQYVNDRPYAASSLLAVAMADVFSTARAGRCRARQDLADTAIPIEIRLPVLPCRGGPQIAHRVFEPLGWRVSAQPIALDQRFAEWGDSRYVDLTLSGTLRLADALSQLYVLLPVLDEAKHYWQGPDEVDKLLRAGAGWLADHPEVELITRRYLGRSRGFAKVALERLTELDEAAAEAPSGETAEPSVPLNVRRHEAVIEALAAAGATSVLDLGCGPGQLLRKLVAIPTFTRIVGADVDSRALQIAARRLHLDELGDRQAARIDLFHSALTYEDDRYQGFDAAVLMEVIEHVDPSRLEALEHVVFGVARPRTVIVTTPNCEYNDLYDGLVGMRHSDHRFEWNRNQFREWSEQVAHTHGYRVTITGVGDVDPDRGAPTQLAVFASREVTDD